MGKAVQFCVVLHGYLFSYGLLSISVLHMFYYPLKAIYAICMACTFNDTFPPLFEWLLTIAASSIFCSVAVNIGSHRYFSHKSFQTSRPVQFILAFLSALSGQRGPLWWSSIHSVHHELADKLGDPHSPYLYGFWYAHAGWWINRAYYPIRFDRIPEWLNYPELLIVEMFAIPIHIVLSTRFCEHFGLVYGLSVFGAALALHFELFVNSLCHDRTGDYISPEKKIKDDAVRNIRATMRELNPRISVLEGGVTKDDEGKTQVPNVLEKEVHDNRAKNLFWLAVLNGGEGFHKNHHDDPSCAQHSMLPHEPDLVYWVICFLEKCHLVWNVRHREKTSVHSNRVHMR